VPNLPQLVLTIPVATAAVRVATMQRKISPEFRARSRSEKYATFRDHAPFRLDHFSTNPHLNRNE
jgi:hypothetical protein